jgi:hypothetical protein
MPNPTTPEKKVEMPTAQQKQSDLHAQIMNIRCDSGPKYDADFCNRSAYNEGHRDARHSAAELASAHAQQQDAVVGALVEALKLCRPHMYAHSSNTPDSAFDQLCAALALVKEAK